MGAWFAVTAHFILREHVLKLAQNLIDEKEERLSLLAWLAFALLIAAFGIQIANYEIVMEF